MRTVCLCACMYPDCLLVWSDQCVIVCPLSLPLLLPVTPEAIGFLSTVGFFIVALAILFLYINKKLCFSRVGGLPCLEQHGRRKKGRQGMRQGLGKWPGAVKAALFPFWCQCASLRTRGGSLHAVGGSGFLPPLSAVTLHPSTGSGGDGGRSRREVFARERSSQTSV